MKAGDKVVKVEVPYNSKVFVPWDCTKHEVVGCFPEFGKVYVVTEVIPNIGTTGLSLIGSTVRDKVANKIIGWNSTSFRKLDELKQEAAQRQHQTA